MCSTSVEIENFNIVISSIQFWNFIDFPEKNLPYFYSILFSFYLKFYNESKSIIEFSIITLGRLNLNSINRIRYTHIGI